MLTSTETRKRSCNLLLLKQNFKTFSENKNQGFHFIEIRTFGLAFFPKNSLFLADSTGPGLTAFVL